MTFREVRTEARIKISNNNTISSSVKTATHPDVSEDRGS
jgi:hypothetical protein